MPKLRPRRKIPKSQAHEVVVGCPCDDCLIELQRRRKRVLQRGKVDAAVGRELRKVIHDAAEELRQRNCDAQERCALTPEDCEADLASRSSSSTQLVVGTQNKSAYPARIANTSKLQRWGAAWRQIDRKLGIKEWREWRIGPGLIVLSYTMQVLGLLAAATSGWWTLFGFQAWFFVGMSFRHIKNVFGWFRRRLPRSSEDHMIP